MKRLLLILTACLFLAACSSVPQSITISNTDTPIPTILFEGRGVSIRFPDSYFGGSTEDLDALKEKLKSKGDPYASIADTVSDDSDFYLIYAFDTKPTTSGAVTNFSLAKSEQPDESSLESQIQDMLTVYEQLGGTDVENKSCIHDDYECHEFQATLTQNGLTLRIVQFMVRNGKEIYYLSFGTDVKDFPKLYDEFSQAFSTFQITEND